MRFTTPALFIIVGTLAMSAPASAEDVYVGGRAGGVGIGVDIGGPHRDRVVRDRVVTERRVYRDDDYARGSCKTIIIREAGMTKKIRKCRD